MKTKATILVLVLVSIGLVASCNKETKSKRPAAKAVSAKQVTGKLPDVMFQKNVNPKTVFTVSRSGHVAALELLADFSACRKISITRNTTGIHREGYSAVGNLAPDEQRFEDTLPNAGAFYYWVKIYLVEGDPKSFGPIRIGPDMESRGTYPNLDETYHFLITRTYNKTSISWNFPEEKYRRIVIKRNSNQKIPNRTDVHATLEWIGGITEKLPDPEADYWYWIEATLESGRIISQGPIRAEYSKK